MNRLKWLFMSKYRKLIYSIECAEANNQRLHLSNGIILDFTKNNARLKDYDDEAVGLVIHANDK